MLHRLVLQPKDLRLLLPRALLAERVVCQMITAFRYVLLAYFFYMYE